MAGTVLGLAAALAATPPAPAAEPTRAIGDALLLQPGATCLERERLAGLVSDFHGEAPIDARIELVVLGDPSRPDRAQFEVRWLGTVVVERAFDPAPAACDDLHEVLAVALAFAIDRDSLDDAIARTVEPAPEPEPAPAPAPKPEPPPSPSDAEPPRPPPAPRLGVSLGVRGTVLVGVLPNVAGGGGAVMGLEPHRLVDVRVHGMFALAPRRAFAGGDIDSDLGGGGVRLCVGAPARARVRPRGCAGASLAGVRWRARGFGDPASGAYPWLGAELGAALQIALSPRVALEVVAMAAAALVRGRYVLTTGDGPRMLEPPPVAGLFALGPVFRVR